MKKKELYDRTIGYFLRPVASLLADEDVSEIMINGHDVVYYEVAGKVQRAGAEHHFPDEESLLAAARNIGEFVNRRVDEHNHSMDARLPDGSRVHVIIAPAARKGTCISIRKFKEATSSFDKLIEWGSLTATAAEFLQICVRLHKNIVISGGTGTGKTSLLNAMSSAIDEHERIIVIEDSSELKLVQPHTIYLEAQPPGPDGHGQVTIRDLFVHSLRMRPDRIIVGEVRRGEALDLIQSMISGHAGALTTVHANTPLDAAIRLETLSLMSDVAIPMSVARLQVSSALNVIVQLVRLDDGTRKVQRISEVLDLDDKNQYRMREIFRLETKGRDENGRILSDMTVVEPPSFHAEPFDMGLEKAVNLTDELFFASSADAC